MELFKVQEWVKESTDTTMEKYRQAVHTLIVAISISSKLNTRMIIKGGILLGVRFRNERFTNDVDFSTADIYDMEEKEDLVRELDKGLIDAAETLDYGMDLRVQSAKKNPTRDGASFPTLKITIGYAYKGSAEHKNLMRKSGHCSTILHVDYSFNEKNFEVDTLEVRPGGTIQAYSLTDLVAEKYRAIIQQKTRNRIRRQDPYDIYRLLEDGFLGDKILKPRILTSLKIKAYSRNIEINQNTLDDDEIFDRSKSEYETLNQEIAGTLPPFDNLFSIVKAYYKSLPWDAWTADREKSFFQEKIKRTGE